MKTTRLFFRKKLMPVLSVFTALLFFSGIIINDFVHPLVHEHKTDVAHTTAIEKDPCHRAVYHGEKESDPSHRNHYVPVDTKCKLCDVVFSHDYIKTDEQQLIRASSPGGEQVLFYASVSFQFHSFPLSRGPPALI